MEKRTIGSFIAVLRKASGMTQRQLAEKLNVSDKAVSRWEREETLPDLTLIPVLADIFGVTADELLRGCRSTAAASPARNEEQSQKQLKYLLDKTRTDCKVLTLVSILVAILGLLATAALNLGFTRPLLGFWTGSGFFAIGATLQCIFTIGCFARLKAGEFEGELLSACKYSVARYSYWGFAVIAALFAFTLPLASAPEPDWYIPLQAWLMPQRLSYYGIPQPGLLILLAAGILWLPLGILLRRMGPRGKLFLGCLLVLALAMALTAAGLHMVSSTLQDNLHWMGQATAHESIQDYIALMETPLNENGEPQETEVHPYGQETAMACILGEDLYHVHYPKHTPVNQKEYTYFELNHTIVCTSRQNDVYYTYTAQQLERANRMAQGITMALMLLYPAEICIAWLSYRKKAKALPK